MRTGGKHLHSWKVDDERRKRSITSSIQGSPITNNDSPRGYTHGKTHTGNTYKKQSTDVKFI